MAPYSADFSQEPNRGQTEAGGFISRYSLGSTPVKPSGNAGVFTHSIHIRTSKFEQKPTKRTKIWSSWRRSPFPSLASVKWIGRSVTIRRTIHRSQTEAEPRPTDSLLGIFLGSTPVKTDWPSAFCASLRLFVATGLSTSGSALCPPCLCGSIQPFRDLAASRQPRPGSPERVNFR